MAKALRLLQQTTSGASNDFENIDSLGEIKEYGGKKIGTARSCGWTGALPATIYLICKYEEMGLFEALKADALIGGDSSARGIILATVLSPFSEHNGKSLPHGWYQDLKLKDSIEQLVQKIQNH